MTMQHLQAGHLIDLAEALTAVTEELSEETQSLTSPACGLGLAANMLAQNFKELAYRHLSEVEATEAARSRANQTKEGSSYD
ncbi:hypothetical protein U5801_01910 [Lamprobacter modestohalophilus]|uniref:hypothetical protein n=1 Tax=Lamprobacter modestohalophilus TaxID=1064514 RepID=UPI002ADEE9CB|nr:hypothetical protein [Lamprobacter modestohalophilus]MEA1048579.1 hypothetical protein [Lamprobacter modestohalophilus]